MMLNARVILLSCMFSSLLTPALAQPSGAPGPFARASVERAVRATLSSNAPRPSAQSQPGKRDSNWNGVVIGAAIGAAMGPVLATANGRSYK